VKFEWAESARSELRRIERVAAMRILEALTSYAATGEGDVKALTGDWRGYYRLRIGQYRVIFRLGPESISIVRVRHRADVYK
jgi:mRNA interferase RelE/StbE